MHRTMNDRSARIAMLLGLAPLAVVTFLLGGTIIEKSLVNRSGLQLTFGLTTLLICFAVAWIWRRHVRWHAKRIVWTSLLTLLVFAQIIAWQPMWSMPGCAQQDELLAAQSTGSIGIWCAGCAMLWWGLVVFRRQYRSNSRPEQGRLTMSSSAVRLAIGLALIPFLPALFFIVFLAMDKLANFNSTMEVCIAYEACAIVTVILWITLWRSSIEWKAFKRRMTVLLVLGLLLVPFSVFLPNGPWYWEMTQDTLPLLMLATWFIGTALAWRTKSPSFHGFTPNAPEQLEEIIRCPQCRYSLIGLREARCPECGWNSTLDDIVGRSLARVMDAED
ncbi:MAG: hypothetical protein ACE5EC_03275 [Phycisphaerae bacterium]